MRPENEEEKTIKKKITWKNRPREFPNFTPELRKINELIAYGMNGKEVAQYFKAKNLRTWLKYFGIKFNIPFTYYKKEVLRKLKTGTYE